MSGETRESESGWTTTTSQALVLRLLEEFDKRYQQRFEGQQQAVEVALNAVNREFHEHLANARAETQAALMAAEKAITKAERATEKRFECVSADTPILCADLIWRPSGDLLVGDELVAFDEHTMPGDISRRGRRFRRATVTANSVERDALLTVTTTGGTVRCNRQHPWLVRRGNSQENWRWVETGDLQPGDAVKHALDVWQVDRSWEAGWLAGMYDGEGCLCLDRNHRSQLTMSQRESPTSDLIGQAIKARVDSLHAYRLEPGGVSTPKNTQPFFHFMVTRLPDILTILGSVRPPRLLAKSDTAWVDKPLGGWGRSATVTSVEGSGSGLIACLSTTTHTYIAGGFAMHNSVNEFRAQQTELIATTISKSDAEHRFAALGEKLDALDRRFGDSMSRVNSRLDLTQGRDKGTGDSYGVLLAVAGLLVPTVIAVVYLLAK